MCRVSIVFFFNWLPFSGVPKASSKILGSILGPLVYENRQVGIPAKTPNCSSQRARLRLLLPDNQRLISMPCGWFFSHTRE